MPKPSICLYLSIYLCIYLSLSIYIYIQKSKPVSGKTICDFEIPMGTRVMHIVTSGYAASVGETDPRIRNLGLTEAHSTAECSF